MRKLNRSLYLYIIIVVEGYIVLSTELLAIRQTIPVVGSGTDTVSIIIAAVLMPLAFGYQSGGRFRPRRFFSEFITIRKKLLFNILISALILLPGLSYVFTLYFFNAMTETGIHNRLAQTAIYCAFFIVIPVYLLGQTIPLVSNYFSKERLSRMTGRMLFFSTLGSFMGAVFSTLVLMSTIGVHHTASLVFILLACLVILLSKNKLSEYVILSFFICAFALMANSNALMASFDIVKNNQYNTIMVKTIGAGNRNLYLNNNNSSMYNDRGQKHPYIEFTEQVALLPIQPPDYQGPPKEILVIGAGGFTFGHEDRYNNYTFVDIDKDLKKIAEDYILKEKLGPNKSFKPVPARAFLYNTDKKYDIIFLDVFISGYNTPEHLVTREFFQQIKGALNDKGLLISNFIASPNFNNTYSRTLDNTVRSVFPHVSRHVIMNYYSLWSDDKSAKANVAYIYRHEKDYKTGSIYTDDKNTVFYDIPQKNQTSKR
jgi:predicted membrane-bound spermidine synthase